MPLLSPKKLSPSNSAPVIGLASHSRPVNPWSAHALTLGKSPSPFPRFCHAISTTATATGELFLFGGHAHGSDRNDLYLFSTRDFSTTLLQTRGETPSPRWAHGVALTSTLLLVWGGWTDSMNVQNCYDDSLYLLNLVSRGWSRVMVNGPGPCGRYCHTVTLVGSNLFIFGGRIDHINFNDIWALDLNRLNSNPFWESYEPAPGDRKPPPRFGGCIDGHCYNDTWSFDISTRKWTELQCTGSIPSPRAGHAAVLVDDVMYVFGGRAIDGTNLGDLTAFNLSTQQWTTFQDIGPSPSGRGYHAMASAGTRFFVLGGKLSAETQVDEEVIHVLDPKLLDYPNPDSNAVNFSETTTQLAQKLSASPSTQGRPQQPTSSLDAHAARGASPFQINSFEELDRRASPQIACEQNSSPNDLPPRPPGVGDKPRRVPEEDDHSENSTEDHAKLVARDAPSEEEVAQLEHESLTELVRQLSAMLAAQTERNRCIAQLTGELAQKSALLEQAEANAAQAKKRAGLEQREMQAKLDELLLSRDHMLQRAAEASERSQQELAEVRAELEARNAELAAVHSRPKDAESGWAKDKAEADTSRAKNAANVVNTDEDGVMRRLTERMRAVEAEIASLRGNEKSFEMMECTNED